MRNRLFCASICVFVCLIASASAPEFPKAQAWAGRSTIVTAQGTWQKFETQKRGEKTSLVYRESDDDGVSWSEPYSCCELPEGSWGGGATLIDKNGEVQMFFIRGRSEGAGKIPAVERFLDLWHMRSTDGRSKWTTPTRIHAGYIGAISNPIQLKSGRIVMPFGDWQSGRERKAPIGAIDCTTIYSDDNGATFTLSDARLSSPVTDDYNGDKVGACEPAIVELNDGRILMLMRTQAGWLYQSMSEDGVHWSEAGPSILHSSTGPPSLLKLKDGSIFVAWNNCIMPPKVDGQGVYAGRDALHGAIADPELKQWKGFREIYRDPTRNLEPPKKGDRGTAYPESLPMRDGRIAIVSGQGGRRALFYVDPKWLLETSASDDFSRGVDDWCVFTQFGKAAGWWRNRKQGAELIAHPNRADAKVLQLNRADDTDPDGAVWNFPSGRQGALSIRLMLRSGSTGGSIALNDTFFDPIDSAGGKNAMFILPLAADGKIGDTSLSADRWYAIELNWDLNSKACKVSIDGQSASTLELANPTQTGICYLRLRSSAKSIDAAGWIVESVKVSVSNP